MSNNQNQIKQDGVSQKKRKLNHRYDHISPVGSKPLLTGTDTRQSIIENRQVKIKLAGHSPDYDVSLSLLQKHSDFFAKTFKVNMKESTEGCVELRDVTSEVLETFIYWLNEHVIQLPDGSESITDSNLLDFVDVYNFADLYDTRELRNAVITLFLSTWRTDYTLATLGRALHRLRSTSKFYEAILRSSEFRLDLADESVTLIICSEFPQDAMKDLIVKYARRSLRYLDPTRAEMFLESAEDL